MLYKRNMLFLVVLIYATISCMTGVATAQPPGNVEGLYDTLKMWPYFVDTAALELVVAADSTTGWLILNGELISAPYIIKTNDNTVTVNGIDVRRRKHKLPKVEISPEIMAEAVASSTMVWNFQADRKEYGTAEAGRRALAFILKQPVVDTAYLKTGNRVAVVFKGKRYPLNHELEPVVTNVGWNPTLKPRHNLNKTARKLRGHLSRGCLVIKRGTERTAYYQPPKSYEILKRIINVVASTSDLELRTSALAEIVGGSYARAIAEKFTIPKKVD